MTKCPQCGGRAADPRYDGEEPLCFDCAEAMKAEMARAFGAGLPDPPRPFSELERAADEAYWASGTGCALNMDIIRKDDPGAVKEDYFIRDYCALDVFCPQYEAAGCEEAWLREHGGSL